MPGKCKHMGMYTSTATNFLIREMVKFESQKDSAISAGLNVIVFCQQHTVPCLNHSDQRLTWHFQNVFLGAIWTQSCCCTKADHLWPISWQVNVETRVKHKLYDFPTNATGWGMNQHGHCTRVLISWNILSGVLPSFFRQFAEGLKGGSPTLTGWWFLIASHAFHLAQNNNGTFQTDEMLLRSTHYPYLNPVHLAPSSFTMTDILGKPETIPHGRVWKWGIPQKAKKYNGDKAMINQWIDGYPWVQNGTDPHAVNIFHNFSTNVPPSSSNGYYLNFLWYLSRCAWRLRPEKCV
jgi:hypothetical protein